MIPMPLKVKSTFSGFGLMSGTGIELINTSEEWLGVKDYLSSKIFLTTGIELLNSTDRNTPTVIKILQKNISSNAPEAYELDIQNEEIKIIANTAEGAFRGAQTLLQLLPTLPNDTLTDTDVWVIPSGYIQDAPHLQYRGMMLDVARHFFTVEEVKKLIDILAYYKYNALHLHLSDDQGWRIEIKSWPKLTTIGGASEVGGGQGGFYTQEDFKNIVDYASKKYIQIIPEIDMPGHTNAASLSYPQLNGNGKKVVRYTGMRVGFSTLNTHSEGVYKFVDDVVRELAAISPSPYFHIGGDESHVTDKSDYIYFVNRVQKIIHKHGKQMIGWNEIAQAELLPSTVVQFWKSEDQTLDAVTKGCKVIMSPAKKAYLDMKYDNTSKFGLKWAGYIPLQTAYDWSPTNYLQGLPTSAILGLEAPLWSETISKSSELEYLAFPRAIAYAELGWSVDSNRTWTSFKKRLAAQAPFLDKNDVSYYRSPDIPWEQTIKKTKLDGLYNK